MKKVLSLIIIIGVMFLGGLPAPAQVVSSDFVYHSSLSDSLGAPTRMAIDQGDHIYVVDDYYYNIKKFNGDGSLALVIHTSFSPLSVAVNNSGQLFASDKSNGSIYKVNNDGSSSLFTSVSSYPNAMTFSPDNHLYIADNKQKRVIVTDAGGNLTQTIGDNWLVFPTGIAFDTKNNHVIVAEHGAIGDNLQTRVYIYNLAGTLLNTMGSYGNTNGRFYRVQGITVGRCGNIYVCEPFQGNISVFSDNGTFITRFGQFGSAQGQLNVPMDVLFDSQQRVVLASMNNASLERFTISDMLPSANLTTAYQTICTGETAEIPITLTGTPPWTLTYTINDQNPATIQNITSSPYLLSISAPGLYKVSALNDSSLSGYCFTGSSLVVEKPVPTAMINGNGTPLCSGQLNQVEVMLGGTGPWEITYTLNGMNPVNITNITTNPFILECTQEGTYEITSVKGPDCDGIIIPGSGTVTVNPLPSAAIAAASYHFCEGIQGSIPVTLTGNAPWSFTYTINGLNPVTVNTSTPSFSLPAGAGGIYQIISVNDANCSGNTASAATEVTIEPRPKAMFAYAATNTLVNFTNNSMNATYYFWSFGDTKTSTAANPVHQYKFPGTYSVTLIASNAYCGSVKSTRKISVNNYSDPRNPVVKAEEITGEMTGNDEAIVSVYPNPSNGLFNLDILNPAAGGLSVEVTNVTGQLVYAEVYHHEGSIKEGIFSTTLDLGALSGGVYSLKVISGETSTTTKLVLNK